MSSYLLGQIIGVVILGILAAAIGTPIGIWAANLLDRWERRR